MVNAISVIGYFPNGKTLRPSAQWGSALKHDPRSLADYLQPPTAAPTQ